MSYFQRKMPATPYFGTIPANSDGIKVHDHVWKLIREIHEGQNKGALPSHNIGPGDWVWVKPHQPKVLEPRWKGPYVVLLTTPTPVKVDGIGPWVHCNHVR